MILSIERQLLARPDPSDLWGRDPRRRELSLAVRTLIKEEFGWPNDHFIPDDPFGIACWAHRDSLDCVFAAQCIEKQFGFQQSSSKWERLYDHGSVGEFVEMLMTNDKNG